VARGDVADLARDQEREFARPQQFVVLARDHDRIRFADARRRDGIGLIVADEHLRRWDAQTRGEFVDQECEVGKLPRLDADARADKPPARDRNEDEARRDEQHEFRNRQARKHDAHDPDRDRRHERAEHERPLLTRHA
jgi:hypothetical protein